MLDRILAFIASMLGDASKINNARVVTGSGTCQYIQFGKIVVFDGTIATTGALTNGVVLANGLPPNHTNNSAFYAINNNSATEISGVYINNTGELRLRGAHSSASRSFRISGAYISAS